jgi:hypothetical protein
MTASDRMMHMSRKFGNPENHLGGPTLLKVPLLQTFGHARRQKAQGTGNRPSRSAAQLTNGLASLPCCGIYKNPTAEQEVALFPERPPKPSLD